MYSIACDRLRYSITCILNRDRIALVDTIVDTGALYTCYKAEQIDENLSEEQFKDAERKTIGGFIGGKYGSDFVVFYRYDVRQYTIGTIDLGEKTIWVTFDKRVNDNVLGMDILRSVSYLQYEGSDELVFFKDRDELREFVLGEREDDNT
ncbi:MAG: hypothetical protein IJT00_08505 [Lachnospiraceae bacterium]|nr:hypothetical protein [Lachnospiraceae bacterium]